MEWGTPVWWGRFLLFCVPQNVKTKETNPTSQVYTFSRLWIKFFGGTIQMNSLLGSERIKKLPR